jgi:hypothetical protein
VHHLVIKAESMLGQGVFFLNSFKDQVAQFQGTALDRNFTSENQRRHAEMFDRPQNQMGAALLRRP